MRVGCVRASPGEGSGDPVPVVTVERWAIFDRLGPKSTLVIPLKVPGCKNPIFAEPTFALESEAVAYWETLPQYKQDWVVKLVRESWEV